MTTAIPRVEDYQPTRLSQALMLKDAPLLLTNDYLPLETGYAITPDGMHHVAATTYMRNCTGAMVDWWFGFLRNTEQYVLWHPRDHIYCEWEGPRNNDSTYIGGHHLVHEYIGKRLQKLRISFLSPSIYFGDSWKEDMEKNGYSTAVCGRVGSWEKDGRTVYFGHLVHLIKAEPDGCRMRSRFWLGDVEGLDDPVARSSAVPPSLARDLLQHCAEEMAILGTRLPDLYQDFSKGSKSRL